MATVERARSTGGFLWRPSWIIALGAAAIVLSGLHAAAANPQAKATAEAKKAPHATASQDHVVSGRELVEHPPPPKPFDYDKLTQEAATLLSNYIKIDTTNPPGNELAAAKMLREEFLANGIPATVWEPQPGRGVIAARLHGAGRHTKAIVLLSHLDVVPANPKEWKVPPFSGQIKDGSVWGRGSIDDKGPGVIELMAMLAVKRAGVLLDRDVLFLATADEEQGGKNGAGWVVEHEPNVFRDAGYLLNEGGGIDQRPNGRRFYAISVTEKTPLWLLLTATGQEGHAAVPPDETSVTRMVHALDRLIAYRAPIRIIDPVRDYFKATAALDGGPDEYLNLVKALRDDPDFAKKFLSVPRHNALVRDTITPTMLSGSDKTNVIPATTTAGIDCRLLPGDDPQRVLGTIKKVIDDKSIKTEVTLNFPSISSPRKSQLMTAISKLAQSEDARVVPTMIAGFTDSHYFRQKGLIAYGFIPIELTPAEMRGVHGINEHIPVKELGAGIRRMVELLEYMGVH
jgi:acetylornithine deacetylase/succinyl-diaminopimelate desuccinylase-like protein